MKYKRLIVNAQSIEHLIARLGMIVSSLTDGEQDGIGGGCKWWIEEKEEKNGKGESGGKES